MSLSEMNNTKDLQHFILTRFNLLLWKKDKCGKTVRSKKWLEHRFDLFERYCLPSICRQTCKDFGWIVLFDSTTPLQYKDKIEVYKKECPQLLPVFVEAEQGRCFAEIFKREVIERLNAKRVITTYLDNDDALNVRFVEDIQKRALALNDGTFINYTHGFQLYTDYNYMMQICNRRNHFISVVEPGITTFLKTVYGYGSHYYIDKIRGARIEYVKNIPMWCEVIHEENMDNDAYFLNAQMADDANLLQTTFGVQGTIRHGLDVYLFRFLPRYVKVFFRRCCFKIYGRHW